ncbi:MAG: SRPBCC family protein [Candidatus Marinimicrobia bacterium]|nr:SRPBCC family protein [Candidatus Neomarinimicrobiota bacterium]
MQVINTHKRIFDSTPKQVGALIDTLASSADRLWPNDQWPAMRFDQPLIPGATGGHGPIRYRIEEYQPARSIRFRFLSPSGFNGTHAFEVSEESPVKTVLMHTLEMNTRDLARFSWPVMYQPLHNALLEDALARAEGALGYDPTVIKWSFWVRSLRWVFSAGKARPQQVPEKSLNTDTGIIEC